MPFLPITEKDSPWYTIGAVIGLCFAGTLIFFVVVLSRTSKKLAELDTYGAYGEAKPLAGTDPQQPAAGDQPLPEDPPLPDLDARAEPSASPAEPLSAAGSPPQTTQYGL